MPKKTDAETLLEMKEAIDTARDEANKLDGKIQSGLERLKADFSCASVAEGRTLLKEKEKQVQEIQEQVHEIVTELQEKYEW